MATRDDVPQVPFPVLAAKAGTMKSTVVVKGERQRLPVEAGQLIWNVTLYYLDGDDPVLTTITVPKLPPIQLPPAILQVGFEDAKNLAVQRLMELTRDYQALRSVEWQPTQIRVQDSMQAGVGTVLGSVRAVVVDLGETVGAIVSRNSMEVPELVSLDDTALVTWS